MAEFIVPTGQRVPRQSPRRKNAAGNGARDHICGKRSELRQGEHRIGQWPAAGSGREQRVAIERAVHRIDGARHARLSHDGQTIRLRLGQNRIGGDHDEGCIRAGDAFDDWLQHLRRKPLRQAAAAEFRANFKGSCPKPGSPSDNDAADGIYRSKGADGYAIGRLRRR